MHCARRAVTPHLPRHERLKTSSKLHSNIPDLCFFKFCNQTQSCTLSSNNHTNRKPRYTQVWTCSFLSVRVRAVTRAHALSPPQGHHTVIAPAWGSTCDAAVVSAHLVVCNALVKSVMKQVGSPATSYTYRLPPGQHLGGFWKQNECNPFFLCCMTHVEWCQVTQQQVLPTNPKSSTFCSGSENSDESLLYCVHAPWKLTTHVLLWHLDLNYITLHLSPAMKLGFSLHKRHILLKVRQWWSVLTRRTFISLCKCRVHMSRLLLLRHILIYETSFAGRAWMCKSWIKERSVWIQAVDGLNVCFVRNGWGWRILTWLSELYCGKG